MNRKSLIAVVVCLAGCAETPPPPRVDGAIIEQAVKHAPDRVDGARRSRDAGGARVEESEG